jgi:hypothetical protein
MSEKTYCKYCGNEKTDPSYAYCSWECSEADLEPVPMPCGCTDRTCEECPMYNYRGVEGGCPF